MEKDKNFQAYHAKILSRGQGVRRILGKVKRALLHDGIMLPFGLRAHKELLEDCNRVNDHTYTCFLRAPTQLAAIIGPVIDFLGNPEKEKREINILAFACSNGAEVFTLASWLLTNVPQLRFKIVASDLHPEMVDRCIQAEYSSDEALHSPYVTEEFLENTFESRGEHFIVKDSIREKVEFVQASLLDREDLSSKFDTADIVLAQNVLFHMNLEDASKAFQNAASFLNPKSAFFVEGMDIDLREKLVVESGLHPLDWKIKQIYNETRIHTPSDWWNYYWGTEPYLFFRSNKKARYGTIFLKV